jgi:hypothetical protein
MLSKSSETRLLIEPVLAQATAPPIPLGRRGCMPQRSIPLGTNLELFATILLPILVARGGTDKNKVGRFGQIL